MSLTIRDAVAMAAAPPGWGSTSWAWIDPKGETHKVPSGMIHEEWAYEYLRSRGVQTKMEHTGDDNLRESNYTLLSTGWVRAVNPYEFTVFDRTKLPRRAIVSLIRSIIQRAVVDRVDPEKSTVVMEWVHPRQAYVRISVADFIRQYGGRLWEDRLFSALMGES